MTDHRFDGRAALELAFDHSEDATLLARDEDPSRVCRFVTAIHIVDTGPLDRAAGIELVCALALLFERICAARESDCSNAASGLSWPAIMRRVSRVRRRPSRASCAIAPMALELFAWA